MVSRKDILDFLSGNISNPDIKNPLLKRLTMLSKDRHALESIIESIDKITSYIKGFSNPDQFNDDQLSFDAVLMNFITIGEMVAKLSKDFKIIRDPGNFYITMHKPI